MNEYFGRDNSVQDQESQKAELKLSDQRNESEGLKNYLSEIRSQALTGVLAAFGMSKAARIVKESEQRLLKNRR